MKPHQRKRNGNYLGWLVIFDIDAMQTHTESNTQTTWIIFMVSQLIHETGTEIESDILQTTTDECRSRVIIGTTNLGSIKARSDRVISELELEK